MLVKKEKKISDAERLHIASDRPSAMVIIENQHTSLLRLSNPHSFQRRERMEMAMKKSARVYLVNLNTVNDLTLGADLTLGRP